jgi:hypothetical protein
MKMTFRFNHGLFDGLLRREEERSSHKLQVALAALEQWQRYCYIPEELDLDGKAEYVLREYRRARALNDAALRVVTGN